MSRISNTRPDPPKGPVPRQQPKDNPKITRQRRERMDATAEYNAIRDNYLEQHGQCCWCMQRATEVHHIYGGIHRADSLLDEETWLPVCQDCHRIVEGFSKRTQLYIKYEVTERSHEKYR